MVRTEAQETSLEMEAEESPLVQMTASCVVVGRLNPAILTPQWMIKEGILPEGKLEVNTASTRTSLQFRLAGIVWKANLSRLEAHTESVDGDPGAFVAKVLERLPHTPVQGVGSNFAFLFSGQVGHRLQSLVTSPLADLLVPLGGDKLAQGVTLTLAQEDGAIVNLTVEAEQDDTTLSLNFHRECGSSSAGAEAALLWGDDQAQAQNLLKILLGEP